MKEIGKTKFCRMYRMPKILQTMHSGRLEFFRIKAYFDFRFRVRQFPFNPGYLTFFEPQSHGTWKYFRLIKGPLKAGFTVFEQSTTFQKVGS
jgi:hypothetical protein